MDDAVVEGEEVSQISQRRAIQAWLSHGEGKVHEKVKGNVHAFELSTGLITITLLTRVFIRDHSAQIPYHPEDRAIRHPGVEHHRL